MTTPVVLLPKVRSRVLLDAVGGALPLQDGPFPCAVRLSAHMQRPCSPRDTVVGAHMPTIGKGMKTKVSDLFVVAACESCHRIIDGVGKQEQWFTHSYPAVFFEALMRAHHETMSRWIEMGLITVEGAELI